MRNFRQLETVMPLCLVVVLSSVTPRAKANDAPQGESVDVEHLKRDWSVALESLAEWYGGLKHSSTQAWGEVKAGIVDAYRSLEEAWQEAADEF